jgi:hypothetical protein
MPVSEHGRRPNDLLRQARLRMSSPSGSGRPMSRQELADAVNAYLWKQYEHAANLDANYVGKLERGDHRWPQDLYREAFRVVLGVATDRVLGFFIVRHMALVPATDPDVTDIDPAAVAVGVTAGLDGTDQIARQFADKLALIKKVVDVAPDEAVSIARLADNLIELELNLNIDIGEDGRARLVYRHTLVNIGSPPATRLAREVWFKHTEPPIRIEPVPIDDTSVAIQRVHDTPTLAKFACQMSPAIQPGATATVQYTVDGGLFVDEFYWRQATPRYVRHLAILLRHRGAGRLRDCTAVEEHPDGSENSAAEQLRWDHEGPDILVTLTRDHLRPNQAVTLRWEFDRDAAR